MSDPLSVPPDTSAREEDRFLRDAVRAIADPRLPFPAPPPGVLWVERARRHGVLSSVDAALLRAGHTAPEELERARAPRAIAQLLQRQDLALVARTLDQAGVDWVVVKGPVLGDLVFERPGSREASDLDVLVAPQHLRTALSALQAKGLERLGVDWSQRTWARGAEIPMLAPAGTVVDVHWHLINRRGMRRAFDLATEDLLARKVVRNVAGIKVWSLDDLDLVVHVLLHACLDGCGRWRALLDAQQCLSWLEHRGVAPRALAARANQQQTRSAAWLVIAISTVLDARLERWSEPLAETTWWSRSVERRSRRKSPLTDSLTRRLVRYTSPTTSTSLANLAGYGWSRLVRVVSSDGTSVHADRVREDDPFFERFLQLAGRS